MERYPLFSGNEDTLHFAAEECLRDKIRAKSKTYRTADLEPGVGQIVLNIEKIDLPDNSVDVVIANHVLEHVNDAAALAELYRILRDGGRLLVSFPIVEGWARTYEDPEVRTPTQRDLHFGQFDHIRYYGRDARERIRNAGFTLVEAVCDAKEAVKYSILRGEVLFICLKGNSLIAAA
jgi:SAM-dependent methyltransferase